MGVIGRVIAAVAMAIRQIVWMVVDGVLRPVARTVDAVAGGVWSGLREAFRRDPVETHEVVDDPAQEAVDEKAMAAMMEAERKSWSPGRRVREACELRSLGRRYDHLFDRGDQAQADLHRWVRRLDETALERVLRIHHTSLSRHLDPTGTGCLDLPAPEAVRRRAALVAADREADAEREKAASLVQEAARGIRREAKRRGRRPTLEDVASIAAFRA